MHKDKYFIADEMTRKILLLFIFEKMEILLSEESLSEIIMANPDWMTYMDYKDALAKIQESKFVSAKNVSGDILYHLSQDGRMCLSHFFVKIPASVREEVISYAKENHIRMKRSQEYTYDYFKNADATHTIVLKIKDNSTPENLMELRMRVSTRADAMRAVKRWKQKASTVYENIWDTIIEPDDSDRSKLPDANLEEKFYANSAGSTYPTEIEEFTDAI